MKALIRILVTVVVFGLAGCSQNLTDGYALQEGDLLFQSLPHGPLVDAIETITASPYSHCGILALKNDRWVVIEAIGPVKETPLREWIHRGRGKRFEAYRLEESLRPSIQGILSEARRYLGRPYDIQYRFDDDRIYCSELIYKAVKSATGCTLGKVQRLGDLNWKPSETFIRSIEGEVPEGREMITPVALTRAGELRRIHGKLSE